MYKPILIFLLTLLVSACKTGADVTYKFGCDPPCMQKHWLTFSYDCAYLFQDSTGGIKQTLENDSLLRFTRHHNAPRLSAEAVKNIDEALSCRLWTCDKTPIKKEDYDPETIIVFVQSTVPVAYITICSKSNRVDCFPPSDNTEIALMQSILFWIKQEE